MPNKETKKTESARKQQSPLVYIAIVLCMLILIGLGFFMLRNQINHVEKKAVTIGSSQFVLEVARTQSEREKGLSERDAIPTNGGMLFDFSQNGDWQMWMLQMRFPIDIAWISKDGRIVKIKSSAQPGDYPEVYHAEQPSWFVIEVPAGTFEKLNVHEGDTIKL